MPAENYPVKVSVCMLAYNQADLFREAIESVVTQKTNFPFEIIVCDDASTDGTSEVLREYERNYPHLVRAVYQEKNIGHYANYVEAHNYARGEYAAHLDGDDLFLPGKLQAQADFLDTHPEVSVVWHAVKLIDRESRDIGRISIRSNVAPDGIITIEDVLEIGTMGIHSATMYRTSARTTRVADISPIDWYFAVEFLSHGTGYQLAEELGVYRKLEGTSHSSNPVIARQVRWHFANMIMHFQKEFPQYRKQLFTLALLYFLSDIRASSSSALYMVKPLLSGFSFLSPSDFSSALKRYRAVSKAFRGFS